MAGTATSLITPLTGLFACQLAGVQFSQWVAAVLYNGLGRYETALAQAQQASEQTPEMFISMFALPELIEAASRTGQTRLAADALGRLAEATSVGQTEDGIHHRWSSELTFAPGGNTSSLDPV